MDAIEGLIALFLTQGGRVFISPQYDVAYSKEQLDGGACPDFVALDMTNREVVIVEVTTASNLRALFDRVKARETRWFNPIVRRLIEDDVVTLNWKKRFLGFVREEAAAAANAEFATDSDVYFVGLERAAFSFAYWKERAGGLPRRDMST
jgi:hypothetical protein